MSTSPIGYKKTLILVIDNDENLPKSRLSQSKIIAFNKDDGKPKWTISRPHHRSGWSTPTIWNNGKNDELIVLGNERVRSYDPSTGIENWFVGGFSRETIAVPVVGNGHVYISSAQLGGGADKQIDPDPFWKALLKFDTNDDNKVSRTEMIGDFTYPLRPELPLGHPGFGIPLPKEPNHRKERIDGILRWIDANKDNAWTRDEFVNHMKFKRGRPLLLAIRSGGTGNVEESHVSWELNRSIPEIPSPLFYENKIYLVRNGGIFAAVDAVSGKQLYRERVSGSGQYSASPIVANRHLYLVSERGQVSVIEPGKTFSQIHEYDIGEPVFVSPAVDASSIYFRSDKHLWAFRKQ
jgi:outer membrane protein assembly factor BamB